MRPPFRRRPRAGGGGAEPLPLEGGLGERPGLAAAVVRRLVEPGRRTRGRPSACPTAKPAGRATDRVLDGCSRRVRAAMTCRTEALGRTAWRARRRSRLSDVATYGYTLAVTSTGIRELKDNLSRYIRRIEAGERIAVTAHGRVVAELVPPGATTKGTPSRFDELVASSVIRPPLEAGDPTEGWPDIRLPAGTGAELIDADRGDA